MRSNSTTTHGYTYGQVVGHVTCDSCGKRHPAEYSHEGQWNQGPIFAVVCTTDGWVTDYYRESAVTR
jgi:hypothetical protein